MADGTGAHQGRAGVQQCRADRAEDIHGGADRAGTHQCGADRTGVHQCRGDRAEDLHNGAEDPRTRAGGTIDHGRDWDLGNTETNKTDRAFMAPRDEAENTTN